MKGFSVADTRFLVKAGAGPSHNNGDGEDAIQMAEPLRKRSVLKLLSSHA